MGIFFGSFDLRIVFSVLLTKRYGSVCESVSKQQESFFFNISGGVCAYAYICVDVCVCVHVYVCVCVCVCVNL